MFGLVILLTVSAIAAGETAARFYPVEAVQPGLRGTGKTVMRGVDVESFEVEYIGVMRDAGPSGDLILVRVSGSAIDRSGGIAAGMSGSPVYIDDQLVGAIGYGYNMADHRVGLVTPIGDMLSVLDLVGRDEEWAPQSPPMDLSDTRSVVPSAVVFARSFAEAEALSKDLADDTHVFAPVQTPVLAGGFGRRALDFLADRWQGSQLVPLQGSGSPHGVDGPKTLQPGSSFGVQLARGDISLTSIGTVTYVDKDRFIGFGHPFTNRGSVEFVASSAYVHDVVQADSMPFKLGAPLDSVGMLLQDRGAGVGGRLGPEPPMIPVRVSIHDVDRDESASYQFDIVRDRDYTVDLATSGALSLLDRSVDRIGRGTARVVFHVDGDGLSQPLVRDNVYYSDFDISALSLLEFMEAISLVVNNRFQDVDVRDIHLQAQIEQRRITAHVEQAVPDKTEALPGETVQIAVTLRPYREAPFTEILQLKIPADAGRGGTTVEVRGGGWGLRPPVAEEDTILDDPETALGETVSDLSRLVDQFTRRERNNELVAEFYGSRRRDANLKERQNEDADNGNGEWQHVFPGGGWVVVSKPTDYVLLGTSHFDLVIKSPEDEVPDNLEDEYDGQEEPSAAPPYER